MDDLELAQRLLKREPLALELFAERYYDTLYRFLRQVTRRRELAEDLTQQTMLLAYQKIGTFQGKASLKTWLHRIAFREYMVWKRKNRILAPLGLVSGAPEPGYQQVEEAEALLKLLDTLPTALRETLLLHYVQGLSIEEIAIVTGSPAGTIKSRLHHSRQRLQAEAESGSPSALSPTLTVAKGEAL